MDPGVRRPLKSRAVPFFGVLAVRLQRAGVTPNAISLLSIVFGCAAGAAFVLTGRVESEVARRGAFLAAAVCIQLRLLANMLDGMVAVEGGLATPTGELFNEVPDRASDIATLAGAGLAVGSRLDLGLVTSILAVLVAYVRAIGASVGAGQLFIGPAAKPHRMACMTVACLLCAILPSGAQPVHDASGIGIVGVALGLVALGCVVTFVRRLRRIASSMRARAGNPR